MNECTKTNYSCNSAFKADGLLNNSDATEISVRGCERRCIDNNVNSSAVRNGNG